MGLGFRMVAPLVTRSDTADAAPRLAGPPALSVPLTAADDALTGPRSTAPPVPVRVAARAPPDSVAFPRAVRPAAARLARAVAASWVAPVTPAVPAATDAGVSPGLVMVTVVPAMSTPRSLV